MYSRNPLNIRIARSLLTHVGLAKAVVDGSVAPDVCRRLLRWSPAIVQKDFNIKNANSFVILMRRLPHGVDWRKERGSVHK